eukprot:364705-Chlamydomonas_euryale.AAC.5
MASVAETSDAGAPTCSSTSSGSCSSIEVSGMLPRRRAQGSEMGSARVSVAALLTRTATWLVGPTRHNRSVWRRTPSATVTAPAPPHRPAGALCFSLCVKCASAKWTPGIHRSTPWLLSLMRQAA